MIQKKRTKRTVEQGKKTTNKQRYKLTKNKEERNAGWAKDRSTVP
jgi:hypothetical protein